MKIQHPVRKYQEQATIIFEKKKWGILEFMKTESVLMNCKPNIKILHYMSQSLFRHTINHYYTRFQTSGIR